MFQLLKSNRTVLMLTALAAAGAVWITGCTSDEPNPVGAGVPGELQVDNPVSVTLTQVLNPGHVGIVDEDVVYDQLEALYFGASGDDSSSILVRYDLTTLADQLPEDVVLTADMITTVKIFLYQLEFYEPTDTLNIDMKTFRVYNLAEPLDTSLYPGPEPAAAELLATEEDLGTVVFLDLNPATLIDWLENGHNGIIIREGEDSSDGIIGYAATDMSESGYGEIDRESEATTVGPSLQIAFDFQYVDADETTQSFTETLVLEAVEDVSTFHALAEPSADLVADMTLQTHLRISPHFSFDTTSLPEGVFINRAVIRLALDFDNTFGEFQSLALHRVPRSLIDGVESITLQAIEDEGTPVTGQFAVDYEALLAAEGDWIGWDVTSTVQRIINGVIDPDQVFMITAGETFSGYLVTSAYSPDFYFSRYVFKGTDEPVLAPHLEITYTPFSGGAR